MKTLKVNDVIGRHEDDKKGPPRLQRVLWFDAAKDLVVLFDLTNPLKRPTWRSYRSLKHDLDDGTALLTEFRLSSIMLRDERDIPEQYRSARDRSWKLIEPLVARTNVPTIYDRVQGGPLIAKIAKANRKTRKAVLRVLYRYWKYGQVRNALLPAWENSGGRGKQRVAKTAKLGRPPKCVVTGHDPSKTGVNVTDESRRLMLVGHNLFYKKDNRHSIRTAYNETLKKFFAAGYEEKNGILVPIPRPAHEVPTYNQFKYAVEKEIDSTEVARARMGEVQWNLTRRALLGTARDNVYGPGERFEIDSTIGDVYLVSGYNREWIIGRPIIYVLVDVFSRLIGGVYIGLIGPSWEGGRLALMNAFSNKVDYCRRFGVVITYDQWPFEHLPQKILADRAEFLGPATEGLVNGLNIEVENAAAFRGDWKPIVERRFRIINSGTVEWVPGAVRERGRECRRRDYRLDATLNIAEFTHVVLNCVLEHNLYTARPELRTKEMKADNVNPYPVDMWSWGIEHLTGGLKRRSVDEVRTHLLPSGDATVTARGIIFETRPYTCELAQKENWFARARSSGSWRIKVKYDPNSTNEIYFRPNDASSFITSNLIDPNERFANMTVEEATDCLEFEKLMGRDRVDGERRGTTALSADSESVIDKAIAAKKRSKSGASPREQITNIKVNRKNERDVERILNAKTSSSSNDAVVCPFPGNRAAPTIRASREHRNEELLKLIKQERDERWDKT